jgi:hypothetical protein
VRRNEGNTVEKSMSRMKFVRNVQYFVCSAGGEVYGTSRGEGRLCD